MAELCRILLNLYWLLENQPNTRVAHIICDNQYAIKACLQLNYPHIKHVLIVQKILQIQRSLCDNIEIQFHWIPSHTDNITHTHVDTNARRCITESHSHLITVSSLLCKHTDALASGGILSH